MELSNHPLTYYAMLDICSRHRRGTYRGLDPMQVMEDYPKINFDNMTEHLFKLFLQEHYQ